mmetsp:Transcript_19610/g.30216  ORF Transcript_19610/g.30216 Transcript_19610/m.30216 type:complete len:243 (-) Transcript_19610:72-800(-)
MQSKPAGVTGVFYCLEQRRFVHGCSYLRPAALLHTTEADRSVGRSHLDGVSLAERCSLLVASRASQLLGLSFNLTFERIMVSAHDILDLPGGHDEVVEAGHPHDSLGQSRCKQEILAALRLDLERVIVGLRGFSSDTGLRMLRRDAAGYYIPEVEHCVVFREGFLVLEGDAGVGKINVDESLGVRLPLENLELGHLLLQPPAHLEIIETTLVQMLVVPRPEVFVGLLDLRSVGGLALELFLK